MSDFPILDVRPAASFGAGHRAGAASIPLEDLPRRTHELPARDTPMIVFDDCPSRAAQAADFLRKSERAVADVVSGAKWLAEGPVERGEKSARLWRPHKLLEEAIAITKSRESNGPRALDIACGSGRDAVFLAMNGFKVEAWDVLPDALERCDELAMRWGVRVQTACRDVETDMQIPANAYDLLCVFNFLHRPLMPIIAQAVKPGGLLVYETFTTRQRELFGKPHRDNHLLQPGELPEWFQDWDQIVSREGLTGPGRWAASLIARKI